ncbi:MAG: DUF2520 domain-containing protein [Megasphaera sp.]|jgi:predicted short-subunit dehydrogenase-like oxidoreductase (DUF2520 family)|nr:DUF2520 domain-containing protein [Megasphaera sp.]MCI1248508.1 DUF2520 domain-containing protein [Megasphaera sp.]
MRLGIIGAGRVGASFILALKHAVHIVGISCSTADSTRQKAAALGMTPYENPIDLVNRCDVVLITTGDDVIGDIGQALACGGAEPQHTTGGTVIFHCSGSLGLAPLAPLAAVGFHVGSLHPLQSFAKPAGGQLHQIYMAVDGDETAYTAGETMAALVGSHVFRVPEAERPLYHAAACFCSNYVVTVAAMAQKLMARWTPTPQAAADALRPLLKGTLDNLMDQEVLRQALTGPVSRGDAGTVQKHVDCLPQEYLEAYCVLAKETADLALQNGTIIPKQHDQLTRILAMAKGDFHE